MKTKSLFLTVAAAILFTAGSITLSGCGNSPNNKSTEHVHESTEVKHDRDMDNKDENGEMAEAHYQCPMKCEGDKMYDKPGKCPVCKMDLKKVKEDSGHEGHNH